MINRDFIKLLLTLIIVMMVVATKAQNVGVNATGSTPNASAGLDVDFTNKGMLVPRVALTSISDVVTVATPATSLLVYNTATAGTAPNNVTPGFYYWSGTSWNKLAVASGSSNNWTTSGNSGTTPGTHFVGTTDSKDFVFKTNNDEYMRITSDGKLGINTDTPEEFIHIANGAGNVLLDKNVQIKAQNGSMSPDFNLIGYYGMSEISIGEITNEVTKMYINVPNASFMSSDDGAIQFKDQSTGYPIMSMLENHRIGIHTDTPEELFHIARGSGNMLLDKDVRINAQNSSMSPDFNLLGFYGMNEINIGESTNEVTKMYIHVPNAGFMSTDDGAIQFKDQSTFTPVMSMMENHRIGIHTDAPEELFHIAYGAGNILLDKNVRINAQSGSMANDVNLLGFFGMNEINLGESSSEVNLLNIFVPNAGFMSSDDGAVQFKDQSSGTSLMRLQEDHKVGINTDSPQELLDVQGKVRIGNYTLPDVDGTSGQVLSTNGSGLVGWTSVSGSAGWGLNGNTGTTSGTNFIGTTDAVDFVTKTSGVERMKVSSSGNVAIGNVTSPNGLLTINSNITGVSPGVPGIILGNNGNSFITLGKDATNFLHIAWLDPSYGEMYVPNKPLVLQRTGFGGNVGISTTNPLTKLDLRGMTLKTTSSALNYLFQIGSSDVANPLVIQMGIKTDITATSRYGAIEVDDAGTKRDLILQTTSVGNVGIGTVTPGAKLEVNGQVKITGGTPGAGKVLVSDAAGLATWQTVAGVAGQWMLTGNAGTSAATNFVGTIDAIDFVTRTNNTEKMRITSAGNLGVGDASPLALFTVGSGDLFQVVSTGHARGISGTATLPSFSFTGDTDNGMYLSNTNEMSFSTAATQRMVINATGNVGIGIAAPNNKLDVSAAGTATNGVTGFNEVVAHFKNTTAATHSAVSMDALTGQDPIVYFSENGSPIWDLRNDSDAPNKFQIRWQGGTGVNTARLTIDNTGNVGIGTVSPTQKLTVFNGTTTGTYTTTGWVHSSDARLKTNVVPLENSLEKVMKLNGVSYNWINNPDHERQIGFIAQEVEKVLPEVVVVDAEGNYGMAYQNMNALLVEAMKEQQKQLEEMKKQYEELMKELEKMKTAIANSTIEAKK